MQDAGSQQIGFLLGSCGVTLALTTDVCQKGLPKAHTGEVATFKGQYITKTNDFDEFSIIQNHLDLIKIIYNHAESFRIISSHSDSF